MKTLIGRKKEVELLKGLISSKEAEFIAIYGRRRVGKTFLIRQIIPKNEIFMECTGLKDGKLHEQLLNFTQAFANTFHSGLKLQPSKNWREAFELFTDEIKKIKQNKKIILFLDELPWLATKKSNLLQNLDHFWNTQWSRMPNFKLIVCGSAASWMLNKLINAKGGLHNRITRSILLQPFDLSETKQFLEMKKFKLDEKQVLDVYMVLGGVPYYLNQLESKKSVAQNIDELCFKKDGLLYSEFPRLFRSLFEKPEINLQIVETIAKKHYGISFDELIKKTGKKVGGRFSQYLNELEACGFIQKFLPYGRKKRDHFYRVIDEYSLFYIKWISDVVEGQISPQRSNYWLKISKSPPWMSWAGYAFESVCYKHVDKIVTALNLSNGCLVSQWQQKTKSGDKKSGAQIDLLLEREDNAITICEIKYTSQIFILDKECANNLINKMEVFQKNLSPSKELFLVLITVVGLKKNIWSEDLISNVVTLSDFFS